MTQTSDPVPLPLSEIKACREALSAYAPPEDVVKRLRVIESQVRSDPALYGQWLLAKGIAGNRMRLRGEALGDLSEAADVFARLGDAAHLAEAKREAAVAHAWCGEGREAGLDLLRAMAESIAAKDMTGASLAAIEAGRLEIEMGRPQFAAPLFEKALAMDGALLPDLQRRRTEVNQLQAIVDQARRNSSLIPTALAFHQKIEPGLTTAAPRLRLLAALEQARCATLQKNFDAAHRHVGAATDILQQEILPKHPDAFEPFEIAEVEAELALAEGKYQDADEKIKFVIACFVDQDLAGREVKARLLWAKALDALGRRDEAERNLSQALRRAVIRGLIGHADQVRAALAESGGSENMTALDSLAASPAAQDLSRRFVRRKALGAGGQGSVYRAYDIELGGEVALKRVNLAALYDPSQREFAIETARTEIAAASRIDHPGVARIRGLIVEAGGDAWLIEDLIEGPTLRNLMQGGRMPVDQGLDTIKKVAFALSAIHAAKVVHCDLKPENIVFAGTAQPVIIDFGIAVLDPGRRSQAGTRAYMAPEQRRGGRVSPRTDLYQLGVMSLEMFGVKPALGQKFWLHDNGIKSALLSAGLNEPCIDLMHGLVAPMQWLRPASATDVAQTIIDATRVQRRAP
ncbi:MAG: serine/threonine-protein kinase [Methylovirgula sp.]|jgi:tetratricopeptide (TPR) repeat protein